MADFRSDPMDFFKKKQYICPECKKIYKLNKVQYAQNGGKCKKCGTLLMPVDFKVY